MTHLDTERVYLFIFIFICNSLISALYYKDPINYFWHSMSLLSPVKSQKQFFELAGLKCTSMTEQPTAVHSLIYILLQVLLSICMERKVISYEKKHTIPHLQKSTQMHSDWSLCD